MRVVVLSSTQFGYRCIKEAVCMSEGIELVGILTTGPSINISYADKPVIISRHADFSSLARDSGAELAVLQTPVSNEEYLVHLRKWKPDLLLALGWYFKIPRKVRSMAPKGCLGIHASLLPKYRGGAPINWAIINGEKETGVTLFHLTDSIDAGDIVAQIAFPIAPDDTCATVYEKAEAASVRLLLETLPSLAAGKAVRSPQNEKEATCYPQRTPEDGRINWSCSAQEISNFIRAQTRPYPGAFFEIAGKKVTIWDATIEDLPDKHAA